MWNNLNEKLNGNWNKTREYFPEEIYCVLWGDVWNLIRSNGLKRRPFLYWKHVVCFYSASWNLRTLQRSRCVRPCCIKMVIMSPVGQIKVSLILSFILYLELRKCWHHNVIKSIFPAIFLHLYQLSRRNLFWVL